MSSELLQKLEQKVDNAIETIELFRLQVEELENQVKQLEEQKARLQADNAALNEKHKTWERNLTMMLKKLEGIEASENSSAKEQATQQQPAHGQNQPTHKQAVPA